MRLAAKVALTWSNVDMYSNQYTLVIPVKKVPEFVRLYKRSLIIRMLIQIPPDTI
jgi:hypothetical protein